MPHTVQWTVALAVLWAMLSKDWSTHHIIYLNAFKFTKGWSGCKLGVLNLKWCYRPTLIVPMMLLLKQVLVVM